MKKLQETAVLTIDGGKDLSNEDNQDPSTLLQFQDFPKNSPGFNSTRKLSQFDDDESDSPETDILIDGTSEKKQMHAFWEVSYFSQFFDVSAGQVMSRILYSTVPLIKPGFSNYLEKRIKSNPDIYGPLWINITLIFTIAIFGNISEYLRTEGQLTDWHYDYHKIGLAASTVFTYIIVIPMILWFFFWFRGCTLTYTLFEMICCYGYSTSVYVPIAMLWIIDIWMIQYFLVVIGAFLSGIVLVFSFSPVVKSDPSNSFKLSYIILFLIIFFHASLALTFLMYFF